MQSPVFARVSWAVVLIAALILAVNIFQKAIPAVRFPPLDQASSTEAAPAATAPAAVPAAATAGYEAIEVRAPHGDIAVMVASTSAEQELGLGQRDSLPADSGMLFPFETPGIYSFWMKDMRFSLDMVWIRADHTVAGVARDVSPVSYPALFNPPEPISYVLELNADSADRFGIATSTKLVF